MRDNIPKAANRHDVFQSLRQALKPAVLLPSIISGALIWMTGMLLGSAFSAFVFQGRLSAYVGVGVGMFLTSLIVLSLFHGLFSSDKSVIPSPQDAPMVILSTMAASLIALAPPELSDAALFATVFATMIATTILTGVGFAAVGFLRISIFMRYIPYPVVGGVLAGMGWLLAQGSLELVTELELSRETWMQLLARDTLPRWLPVCAAAIFVLWLARRTASAFVLPVAVVLSLAALTIGQAAPFNPANQTSPAVVIEDGAGAEALETAAFEIASLAEVDIGLVLSQAGSIAVLVVISNLNLLAYISASELVFNRELDFNRELAVAGTANVAAGLLGGGFVGFAALAYSSLANQSGGNGRIINLIAGALAAGTLVLGAASAMAFPPQILGGILMFFGFSFLMDWLYDARRQMPLPDYFIVVAMMLAIAALGLISGIIIGVVISTALFILQNSQANVIRQEYSGGKFRSTIDRSYQENQLLRDLGDQIRVFRLQGYIFFGTGYKLYKHIVARIEDERLGAARFLILDFRLVQRLDISTVVDFTKLCQLAEQRDIQILLACASQAVMKVLRNGDLTLGKSAGPGVFDSLDEALEWCENMLLAGNNFDNEAPVPIIRQIGSHETMPPLAFDALSKYLKRVEAPAGETIAFQGEPGDALFHIESGKVDVFLTEGHAMPLRLRSISAGTIVGEVGFYLGQPRSATLVASEDTVLQRLDRSALRRMESKDPQIASAFHTYVSCVLAERLTATNHMVDSLMD